MRRPLGNGRGSESWFFAPFYFYLLKMRLMVPCADMLCNVGIFYKFPNLAVPRRVIILWAFVNFLS